jgi:hypothetical protein
MSIFGRRPLGACIHCSEQFEPDIENDPGLCKACLWRVTNALAELGDDLGYTLEEIVDTVKRNGLLEVLDWLREKHAEVWVSKIPSFSLRTYLMDLEQVSALDRFEPGSRNSGIVELWWEEIGQHTRDARRYANRGRMAA